jgi:hypothetical protein
VLRLRRREEALLSTGEWQNADIGVSMRGSSDEFEDMQFKQGRNCYAQIFSKTMLYYILRFTKPLL